MELTTLYRPVGQTELNLIKETGNKNFHQGLSGSQYFIL
jgi:hypothetical protein